MNIEYRYYLLLWATYVPILESVYVKAFQSVISVTFHWFFELCFMNKINYYYENNMLPLNGSLKRGADRE